MKKLLALIFVASLTGCVSFTSNNTGNTPENEIVGTNRPDVMVNVQVFTTYNGVVDNEKNALLRRSLEKDLINSFNESRTFGTVSRSVYYPKYKVDLTVQGTYTDCKWCNYATYGTLFILPSWSNDKYLYTVRITDLKTNRTYSSEYYETSVEVREILLALAMPFAYDDMSRMHERVLDKITAQVVQLNFGL